MEKMIPYRDAATGCIVNIPAAELSSSCLSCVQDGHVFYAEAGTLKPGPIRRPPLPDVLRENVLRPVVELLGFAFEGGVSEWEDDFRRDKNPVPELLLWAAIAGAFRHFTARLPPGPKAEMEKKRDVAGFLLACVNCGGEVAASAFRAGTLSKSRRAKIAAEFASVPLPEWAGRFLGDSLSLLTKGS